MRNEKLNFGVIVRVFVSLIPILLGMPTLATIFCAYNIAMSFFILGPVTAIVSALCSIGISMLLATSYGPAGEISGLVWGIQAVLAAAGCLQGLKKDRFYKGLCFTTLGILAPQMIYTRYIAHGAGMSIAQMLVPNAEDIKLLINENIGRLQLENQQSLQLNNVILEKVAEQVSEITTLLIPSALIIASMVIAYITLWAVVAQMRKLPIGMIHSFSHIKVPRMCVAIIAVLIVITLTGLAALDTLVGMVALNMLIVLLSMCFFAGISLADFYARRFIPFRLVRVIIHVIISLNAFPLYILAAVIDSFANFRKLPVTLGEKGGEADETEKRNV